MEALSPVSGWPVVSATISCDYCKAVLSFQVISLIFYHVFYQRTSEQVRAVSTGLENHCGVHIYPMSQGFEPYISHREGYNGLPSPLRNHVFVTQ